MKSDRSASTDFQLKARKSIQEVVLDTVYSGRLPVDSELGIEFFLAKEDTPEQGISQLYLVNQPGDKAALEFLQILFCGLMVDQASLELGKTGLKVLNPHSREQGEIRFAITEAERHLLYSFLLDYPGVQAYRCTTPGYFQITFLRE